jgi:hypothetical protein
MRGLGFAENSFAIQKAKDSKTCIILSPQIKIMDNFIKDLNAFWVALVYGTTMAIYEIFEHFKAGSPASSKPKKNI